MKRKNLEKAVLLTVMLMSLNSCVYAAQHDDVECITADGTGTTVTKDFTDGDVYVFKNYKGPTQIPQNFSNIASVTNGANATINIGTDKDAAVTFGQTYRDRVMFEVNGEGSKLTITGGTLTLTNSTYANEGNTSTTANGNSKTFRVYGGAEVHLQNTKTIIDDRWFAEGVRIFTNDATSNKSKFTADGDLVIKTTYGNYYSGANRQSALYIASADFTTKGNTEITMTDTDRSPNGENVAVLIAHNIIPTNNYGDGTFNTRGSEVIFGDDANDVTSIKATNGEDTFGVKIDENQSEEQDKLTFNGTAKVEGYGGTNSYGIQNNNGVLTFNGNAEISAYGKSSATALDLKEGTNNFNGDLTASVTYAGTAKGDFNAINAKDTVVNVEGTSKIDAYNGSASRKFVGINADNSTITLKGAATVSAGEAVISKNNSVVDFQSSFTGNNRSGRTYMTADGGTIKINSLGKGDVVYYGQTIVADTAGSELTMNMNTENSKWTMTDDSELTELNFANNAVIDMASKNTTAGTTGRFRTLTIDGNMSGDGGVFQMNINGAEKDQSDKIVVTGIHEGAHYITLNNVGDNAESALGTVLATVGTENGTFDVKDNEGALYWESYELTDQKNGNNTDWVLSAIKQDDTKPTTSVDTILGANALNYHTWRAENDQLMRRMGELRNNNGDEQGAWFRVHGSKISHDDIAGFENKYTNYVLGYDQLTKETKDMVR